MESKPQSDLIRIVTDGKTALADCEGNMPGRGAYICKSEECLKKAIKKKSIQRAFKGAVSTETLENMFMELCL